MGSDEYRRYLREEWDLFVAHPEERGAAAVEISRHINPIRIVADVGCGAGQELIPYLATARCLAFDAERESLLIASELLGERGAHHAAFARALAEALPVRTGMLDLVISRLVLPYTHVPAAVGEAARVLRSGGGLSVQIHSPRFYLRKLQRGLAARDRLSTRYALRVLRTGAAFHWSGEHRAVNDTLETFLTVARMKTLAAGADLEFVTQILNDNPYAPHLLFRRR